MTLVIEKRWITAASIGVWAAAAAVVPDTALRNALLLPPVLAGIVWWTISNPNRWLIVFFGAAVLTPPLPLDFAGTTLHLAPLLAALGVISGIVRISGWRSPGGAVPVTLLVFLASPHIERGVRRAVLGVERGSG